MSHKKQGLFFRAALSIFAAVLTMRAGLYCTLSVPYSSGNSFTFTQVLSCSHLSATSCHRSSCFLKKSSTSHFLTGEFQRSIMARLVLSSIVLSASLYALFLFCLSMLSAASEFPSHRRHKYSSSKMRAMR